MTESSDNDHSRRDQPADHHVKVQCPVCGGDLVFNTAHRASTISCPGCGENVHLSDDVETIDSDGTNVRLGKFELNDVIGKGAFGIVWKARDTELDRWVAIKVPRHGSIDPVELERFCREARAAAQLNHPAIVSVHEISRDGDSLFIVSDLIDGAPLSDRLETGMLPADDAVALVLRVAEGLQHAHEAGVIHRDLKPQNILVSADGHPHIADFGLARREEGEITVSLDGKILGTPAYMSPEQASGEAHSADRRTDIYSLGVILYQLLSGQLPFRGRIRSVLNQIRHDPIPSLRSRMPSLPRDLDTICQKCLEKAPSQRYSSAAELADDLRRFQQGLAIVARPIGRGEQTLRWIRRKPAEASLAGLVAVLTLGLAMAILWKPTPKDPAIESIAVLVRPNDQHSSSLSRDLTRRINRSLNRLQHLTVAPVGDTLEFEPQDLTATELARRLGTEAAVVGEARFDHDSVSVSLQLASRDGGASLWEKRFDGAPAQLPGFEAGSIESIVGKLGIPLNAEESRSLSKRDLRNPNAFGPYLRARKLQAEGSVSALQEARSLMEQVVNLDPAFADAYAGMAAINAELAYVWLMPRTYFAEAKRWVDKALKLDDNITEAAAVKGLVSYFFEHNWEQGRSYLEEVMNTDSELTELSSCFLHAYDVFQRPDLSIKAVELAIQRNPTSQPLLLERGCTLYYAGDFEQSRDTYLQLSQVFPNNVMIHWGLGRAYGQLGESEKAIEWLKNGRSLPDGEFHGLIAELAYLYAKSGRSEEAETVIKSLNDQKDRGHYVDPYVVALAQMGFLAARPNDSNRQRLVFTALEEAIENRSSWMPSLLVEPKFFPLRSDPRFRALLVRMNLPALTREDGDQE